MKIDQVDEVLELLWRVLRRKLYLRMAGFGEVKGDREVEEDGSDVGSDLLQELGEDFSVPPDELALDFDLRRRAHANDHSRHVFQAVFLHALQFQVAAVEEEHLRESNFPVTWIPAFEEEAHHREIFSRANKKYSEISFDSSFEPFLLCNFQEKSRLLARENPQMRTF